MRSKPGLSTITAILILLTGCAERPAKPASGGPVSGQPRLLRTIPLPGVGVPETPLKPNAIPGRLDHLAYDPVTERLYVAALEQGSLEVIDLKSGLRIQRVQGLNRPQGIAVVRSDETRSAHGGWIVVGCGGDGTARAFDAESVKEVAVTPAGENADNVRFDGRHTVYVGVGGSEGPGALIALDARTLARTGVVPLPLRPESFQLSRADASQRVFANTPGEKTSDNDGMVVVVQRETGVRLASWVLPGCARNFPMAYDEAGGRLFVVCRKPARVLSLDARNGARLAESSCVADSDDAFFDPATHRLYVIGGGRRAADPATAIAPAPGADAALDVIRVGPDGQLAPLASLKTSPHARTGLLVPERRAVYVVAPPHGGADARVLEFSLAE